MNRKVNGVKRTLEEMLSVVRARGGRVPQKDDVDRFIEFYPLAKGEIEQVEEDGVTVEYYTAKFSLEFGNWQRGQRVDFDPIEIDEEDPVEKTPSPMVKSGRSDADLWRDGNRRINRI